ncbi:MAG TPA: SIMPL domain-containing protein [Anaerolineales bacterium]|nr:SIMPL domain-containing protein [Anaerolineales bacterium]
MLKKQLIVGGLMAMAIGLSACGIQSAAPATAPPPRTLNVTGSGKTFIVPDIANISIGVHTEGKDAAEAVASNNAQTQKVAQALQGMGVDGKDIQTSNFSIFPQQQFDETGKVIGTIYVVDNTVYVTVRQLDKLGELLSAVVDSGANSIHSIQFNVEDKQAAISAARKAAVENAQAQAEELAQAAGVTLGEVQSINSYSGFPVPVFEGKGGGGGAPAAEVPVSPGQLTLTVEVNIVYEIK